MNIENTIDERRAYEAHADVVAVSASDAWQHTNAVFDLTPLNASQTTDLVVSRTWMTSACVFGDITFGSNIHRHTHAHVRNSGNLLLVHRYTKGNTVGQIEGAPYTIEPGAIAIRDYGCRFEGMQSACQIQGMYIPHDALGFQSGTHPSHILLEKDSTLGGKIHARFDAIFADLLNGASAVAGQHLRPLLSDVHAAVQGQTDDRDIRAGARDLLGQRIRQYIEDNLGSMDLTVAGLVKEFGASRTTLFRIFEPDGGVRQYIANRRLFRAVVQIAKDPTARGQISEAATAWGFSSQANFSRAVHRYFGTRPSALFEQPLAKPQRSLPKPTITETVARTYSRARSDEKLRSNA